MVGNIFDADLIKIQRDKYGKYFSKDEALSEFEIIKETDNFIYAKIKKDHNKLLTRNTFQRLYEDKILFHPLVKVNPEKITGIYFGLNYKVVNLDRRKLQYFKNQGFRIYSTELNDNEYKINYCNIN
jgi:hypothetical protein